MSTAHNNSHAEGSEDCKLTEHAFVSGDRYTAWRVQNNLYDEEGYLYHMETRAPYVGTIPTEFLPLDQRAFAQKQVLSTDEITDIKFLAFAKRISQADLEKADTALKHFLELCAAKRGIGKAEINLETGEITPQSQCS